MDIERTHPLFRHKVVHKNREFMKGLFCFDFVIVKNTSTKMEELQRGMFQRKKPIKLKGGVSLNSEQEQLKKEAN